MFALLDADKQPPSFTELIQKTLAQLPGSPHIPLPYIKGMPAVPWNALPQIPVFPVVIPLIPGLPAIFGGEGADGVKGKFNSVELRAAWERWLVSMKESETEPPPEYTPRVEPEAGPSSLKVANEVSRSETKVTTPARRYGYNTVAVSEQEIESYRYERKEPKKRALVSYFRLTTTNSCTEDRMLLLFWLPILISTCFRDLRSAYN